MTWSGLDADARLPVDEHRVAVILSIDGPA